MLRGERGRDESFPFGKMLPLLVIAFMFAYNSENTEIDSKVKIPGRLMSLRSLLLNFDVFLLAFKYM